MIIEFLDTVGASVHDSFQAWRAEHQDGAILAMEGKATAVLHGSRCQHLGSGPPYFTAADGFGVLTAKRKICAMETELWAWASARGVAVDPCRHCLHREFIHSGVSGGRNELRVDDVNSALSIVEGAVETILSTRFERDREARRLCLAHHGYACRCCGLTMSDLYGELGEEYIHVHHKLPLSEIRQSYVPNPVEDLVPVCPNCHTMIHRSTTPLSVQQLAEIVQERRRAAAQLGAASR
jgi:HNH endonuclease